MRAIRDFSRSSSFVVGAVFTALLMVGVYFVAYFLVAASDNGFLRESEAAIRADIRSFDDVERIGGIELAIQRLQLRLDDPNNSFFYALQSADNQLLLANIPHWPKSNVEVLREGLINFEVINDDMQHDSQSVRPLSEHYDVMAKIHTFQSGHQLLVGRNVDDLEIAQWVGQTFGWLMIAILILVSVISLSVGYYVVNRINRISDAADRIIDTGNLSERLPVDSNWDDLSKLSMSLNSMLNQLEKQVQSIKAVSDNIAHDLRTPLTRLRASIEGVEAPELRTRLLAEVDNLLAMFNGLLRIADIETAKQKVAFKKHDLNIILEDVLDLYHPLAEEKSQTIASQLPQVSIVGDRDMLFQAFANVVDNAIKFTPEGGHVRVVLTHNNGLVHVSICDSGPGIPSQYRDRVTRRFFRMDKSRSTPGNGLGMALVQAIVDLHSGNLTIDDNPESEQYAGLCCHISLPTAQ